MHDLTTPLSSSLKSSIILIPLHFSVPSNHQLFPHHSTFQFPQIINYSHTTPLSSYLKSSIITTPLHFSVSSNHQLFPQERKIPTVSTPSCVSFSKLVCLLYEVVFPILIYTHLLLIIGHMKSSICSLIPMYCSCPSVF